jgi:hypothetical protein
MRTAAAEAILHEQVPNANFANGFLERLSKLAMASVDLRTVQDLGGWKDPKMVQRYSHLSPGHKAEAIERIACAAVIPLPVRTADRDGGASSSR